MTYWYDRPDDNKGRWHWLNVALSFAFETGLNLNSELVGLSLKQRHSRRRLWWCCFLREKLIIINERRPSSIRDKDADVPILTTADFESDCFSRALERYNISSPALQAEILNSLCIEKIKLCALLARVAETQYMPRGCRRFADAETKILLSPRLSGSTASEAIARDHELGQWARELCATLGGLVSKDPSFNSEIVQVHCALLDLVYQSVRGLIHRPQSLLDHPKDSASSTLQNFSRQVLTESAQKCTETAKCLMEKGLIQYLAPVAVTTLLFAAMQHVRDVDSSDPIAHNTAIQCFNQTVQSLYRLREVYGSAHHAIVLLEIVLQRRREKNTVPSAGQASVFPLTREESRKLFTRQTHLSREQTLSGVRLKTIAPEPVDHTGTPSDLTRFGWPVTGSMYYPSPTSPPGNKEHPLETGLNTEMRIDSDCRSEAFIHEYLDFDCVDWTVMLPDMESW